MKYDMMYSVSNRIFITGKDISSMKKTITSLLVLAMLLSALAACGETPAGTTDTGGSTTNDLAPAAEETVPEPEETELSDNLPEKDFGGADFSIWGDVAEYGYFYTTELTGEVIDDAVYNRNVTLAERFNVNFVYNLDEAGKWRDMNLLNNSVMAGAQAYDLATGVACYLSNAVVAGSLQNLNTKDYLDFNQPWWSAHINRELTVGDRLYIASGFYDMPTVARAHVVFYSTDLAEKYAVGNLYDIVREGTWTFDTMLGLAEQALVDLDGNGIYDENDQYGLTSQWDVLGIDYGASGHSFTSRDEGNITFTEYDEKLLAANDMLYKLLYNTDFYYSGYTKGQPHNYDNMTNIFADNRALFFQNGIVYASDDRLREMGTYGILPTPKFTEEQATYGTYTSCFASGIPADAPDLERSCILLEALNAESFKNVLPAYYDIALSQKFLNDKDSVEMLDIVFENTCCEFSYMFNGGWGADIALSVGLNENYASWYASKIKAYNKMLTKMIEKILALDY